ncbi:MAG: class I SAM-dependent methyltransferase [Hasllibacter sp.]
MAGIWRGVVERMLRGLIRDGRLEIEDEEGRVTGYGPGTGGPLDGPVRVGFKDGRLWRDLAANPHLGAPEAFMDGRLMIPEERLPDLLALLVHNTAQGATGPMRAVEVAARARKRAQQLNPRGRARANVAHHYDLDGGLYDIMLDDDRQYSCAYFPREGMTLDEAQEAKKAHIARKLLPEPGMRVLDIGCGWGGMALTLARDHGAHVTGITLSERQHALATRRVAEAGLEDRIDIRLQDYRDVDGPFDRIVSVGMFEHVGVPNYRAYFDAVARLLTPDGVALIHTIGRTGPPGITSPFIEKYVFPGGYVPALSEVAPAFERARLELTDLEVWRLHYAETLRHWRERVLAHRERVLDLYDERFLRMWLWYLAGSEMTFRHHRQVVFQFQLARRKDAVPITRDYLYRKDDDPPDAAP